MADVTVEPLNETAPAPEVVPAEGAATKSNFSEELLAIPAVQALFAGAPPALSAPIADFAERPEAKEMLKHKDELSRAGMQLYRSLDGSTGVIYNAMKVHGQDIQTADKEGRLQEIAPPFDVVNEGVQGSGANNPVLTAGQPTGMALPSAPSMASPNPVKPAPASAQKKLAGERAKNAQQGAPTSGPTPGQGRLLASILKPVL